MRHLFGFCVKEKESQILLLLLYFILSISAAAALYSTDANVRRKLSKLGYKQIAVVIFPEKKFFFSSSFSSGKLQVVISPQFMRIVQVYELHRLYRIQKILMMKTSTDQNSKPKGQNQERWDSRSGISLNQMMNNNIHQKPPPELDLEQPAEEYVMECDGDGELEIEDENEIRLTLGPTSYYRRRKKAETPPSSDSGPSFSSSSGTDISREETRGQKWGLTMVPDSNYGFQSARKNGFDVEEEQLSLSQDRLQQAPWLFQSLRLNMT